MFAGKQAKQWPGEIGAGDTCSHQKKQNLGPVTQSSAQIQESIWRVMGT